MTAWEIPFIKKKKKMNKNTLDDRVTSVSDVTGT